MFLRGSEEGREGSSSGWGGLQPGEVSPLYITLPPLRTPFPAASPSPFLSPLPASHKAPDKAPL